MIDEVIDIGNQTLYVINAYIYLIIYGVKYILIYYSTYISLSLIIST